jgi:hypothetical protein
VHICVSAILEVEVGGLKFKAFLSKIMRLPTN